MPAEPSTKTQDPKALPAPPPLAGNVRRALAALSLRGPSNITSFSSVAAAVGARESAARAFSTQSLRLAIQPYLDVGWVVETGEGFRCAYGLGSRLLRSFSPKQLTELGESYKTTLPRASYYHSPERDRVSLEVDVMLGLAGAPVDWATALERLFGIDRPSTVVDRVLRDPLHAAFDREWFERFSADQQRRLVLPFLTWCETSGLKLAWFGDYAREAQSIIQRDEELRQLWARVVLLLDGAPGLSADEANAFPAASGVGFLRHVVSGDYQGAGRLLANAFGGKRQPLLPGSAGVFQVLSLLRNEPPAELEDATRLANSGARKGNPFRESFALLKRLLPLQMGRSKSWYELIKSRGPEDMDMLYELVTSLLVLWFKELELEVPYALPRVRRIVAAFEPQGPTWLSEQYRDLRSALQSATPEGSLALLGKLHSAPEERSTGKPPEEDEKSLEITPLRLMLQQKPAWESALGRLENLAAQAAPSPEAAPTLERVMWRVSESYNGVEPFLQRSSANGWTRGRKLAIKHLLPGGAQRGALPPEDQRVANHARESVSTMHGYRETFHFFDRSVWEALIGHPRVYVGESEIPIEVARGVIQLVATSEGDDFCLRVHPRDLRATNNVRREGDRLVVYPITPSVERLLEVVGAGLSVPLAARERLLGTAARLAHIAPLQSSEPVRGEARPGDATPYLRLSPRGLGLTAQLVVRPLGDAGPAFSPGAGSPVVLARIAETPIQASRETSVEIERAREVVQACTVLDGRQVAEWEWSLDTPELCLTLMASVATLDERVRVEWPHGKPLTLRGRIDRASWKGRLSREGVEFLLDASLRVDAELELPLVELLRLLAEQHPQRFIRLEQGDFVELSSDLRDQLAAIAAARLEASAQSSSGAEQVVLPPTSIAALDDLMQQDTRLVLDAPSVKWRDNFAKVFDSKPRIPRGLNAELRDYQVDGFRWLARLAELGFGACLADDMGLGKTVQLIALLLHRSRSGPALVVAPTSVAENWVRELARFAPSLAARVYAGAEREAMRLGLGARDVLITGYTTLQQDSAQLQAIEWGTVILDEAQFIKNASALRTRAALGLRAAMRVAATGTPVENRAEDLYSLFQFVQPGLLGSQASFRRRFPLDDDSAAGRESRRRLRQLIQPFLLRRSKAQVLAELPPLTEIEHMVELSREETLLYEATRRAALAKLNEPSAHETTAGAPKGGGKLAVLAELTRLLRLCCDARLVVPQADIQSSKLRAFGELLGELVAAGHRALVFSQFVDVLKLAAAVLDAQNMSYQYLDGSTPAKQRAAAVDAFQAGEGDAFLISLKAGGFGLNLTAADYVVHLDPWWNPAAEAQATDRARRIGQQNPVTVYRLIAKGTIEERIVGLHRTKRELADSLLADAEKAASLTSKELRALLGE